MAILSALESMSDVVQSDDATSEVLEVALLEVIESDADAMEACQVVADMEATEAGVDESIQRLGEIKAAIEEFGISKSMMTIADPQGELVSAGIVVDYSELSDVPVKDSVSESAINSITGTIKNAWKKLVEFFKKMGKAVVEMFRKVFRVFKSYEKALVELIKKIEKADIDETKLAKLKIKYYSKSDLTDFTTASGLIKDVVDNVLDADFASDLKMKAGDDSATIVKGHGEMRTTFNTTLRTIIDNGNVKAYFGLDVTEKGGIFNITPVPVTKKYSEQTLKDIDFGTTSQVITALKAAYKEVQNAQGAEKRITDIGKQFEETAKLIEGQMSTIEDASEEDIRARSDVFSTLKLINIYVKKLSSAYLSMVRKNTTTMISLGRKTLSVKKK
jgi:predicted metal-dependent hydrolase